MLYKPFAFLLPGLLFFCSIHNIAAERFVHLRTGEREWDSFAPTAEHESLTHTFHVDSEAIPRCLSFRQVDVKQQWTLAINKQPLGQLVRDENDMLIFMDIPSNLIQPGNNQLTVTQTGRATPDDIYFGYLQFHTQTKADYLQQCQIAVKVTDRTTQQPTPCRLTILNNSGSLMTVGNPSTDTTAVRAGVIYTSTGQATIMVPPGRYTIIAGRGMEWGIDSATVTALPAETASQQLTINREVDTRGFVACDTHVHTFTHSRHGDASLDERLITIAGEGIELPIATDHNLHISYEPRATELGVRRYFTPVIGNEVTTRIGHFNIFPVPASAPLPDHTLDTWEQIIGSIREKTGAGIIILNHARDVHSGVTPFSPQRHNSLTGHSIANGPFVANAMELINSGATQTDVMQLYRDWFGMMNRGIQVTGIGCSDSHDVARHFIGQSRTYIRCPDGDPGNLDIPKAVTALQNGKAHVSYGLFTTLRIQDKFGSGEMATPKKQPLLHITVQGPSWVTARQVELYINGYLHKTIPIASGDRAGIKWSGQLRLNQLEHDVFVVAVARGDGVRSLHWPTAKPYQPTSPHFEPYTLGSTGVLQLDIDHDGTFSSARTYAEQLALTHSSPAKLIRALDNYDTAVASHVAELLHRAGTNLSDDALQQHLRRSPRQTKLGFQLYQRSQIPTLAEPSTP